MDSWLPYCWCGIKRRSPTNFSNNAKNATKMLTKNHVDQKYFWIDVMKHNSNRFSRCKAFCNIPAMHLDFWWNVMKEPWQTWLRLVSAAQCSVFLAVKELSTSQKIDAEIARSLLDLSKKAEADSSGGDGQMSGILTPDSQKGNPPTLMPVSSMNESLPDLVRWLITMGYDWYCIELCGSRSFLLKLQFSCPCISDLLVTVCILFRL